MNLAGLTAAIRARAVADTGAGGLFETGNPILTAFNAWRVAPKSAMPYGWFEIVAAVQDDTVPRDEYIATVRLNCVTEASAGFATPDAILDRYYALFHRWTPTLSGGWTAGIMVRIGLGARPEETDEFHFIDDYELRVSKAV